MFHRNLNVLSVLLLLAGCGGGDFSTAGLETGGAGPEGTGGAPEADAGAAGATQGTGGVTGVTGGQSGVTGGSAGTAGDTGGTAGAGTGGQQVGSGGGPGGTGGAATGGQQAATGGASGGSGAGGAAGTCKPPRLMPEDLPQTVVWESYLGTSPNYPGGGGDLCVGCQKSPCTTCSLAWWPVDQSADGSTVTAKAVASGCAPIAVNVALCSNDLSASSCTTWDANGFYATFTFQLLPKSDGTGYRAVHRVTGSWGGISNPQGSCSVDSRAYSEALNSNQPAGAFLISIRDTVTAAEWPCGS